MISYFPSIYYDELLYSLFGRYWSRTGYPFYSFAAADLFVSPKENPSILYKSKLTDDAENILSETTEHIDLIKSHTAFPYAAHFKSLADKKTIYDCLIKNAPSPLLKPKQTVKLKYCPLCAEQDIKHYGEPYWHRIHNIPELNICPKHHCYLVYCSMSSPNEIKVPCLHISEKTTVRDCEIKAENRLSEYIRKVFYHPVEFKEQVSVSIFFQKFLKGTIYFNKDTGLINNQLLIKDFTEFYKGVSLFPPDIENNLRAVILENSTDFYLICMLGCFLDIKADDLVSCNIQKIDHTPYLLDTEKQGQALIKVVSDLHNNQFLTSFEAIQKKQWITRKQYYRCLPYLIGYYMDDLKMVEKIMRF